MGPWGYGGVAVFWGVFPVTAAAGSAECGKGLRYWQLEHGLKRSR
jgi:hypothetical protein